MVLKRLAFVLLLVAVSLGGASSAIVASAVPAAFTAPKTFSVPMDVLKEWSEKAIISLDVKVRGRSNVHLLASDCEMHFGATSAQYQGDPAGIVIEPMNLCLEKPPTGFTSWNLFGDKVVAASVLRVDGVPRIWPEHLDGHESPSNPNHAFEIHPATSFRYKQRTFSFAKFIYAPEGYEGGVGEATAERILNETTVSVRETAGMVEVAFDAGRIGNFTTLEVTVRGSSVTAAPGGHRMDAEVTLGKGKHVAVRALTVGGTDVDDLVVKLTLKPNSTATFEALILFSLSPESLYVAAVQAHNQQVNVAKPIQLILYGEPDGHAEGHDLHR